MLMASTSPTVASQRQRRRRSRVPSPSSISREYVLPTENDVLRGRGGRAGMHSGNRRLLNIIRPQERVYAGLRRGQKERMSQGIVDMVTAWGGHFLDREVDGQGNELYFVMVNKSAIKLVQQKFRDEPRKRKAMKQKRSIEANDKLSKLDPHEDESSPSVVCPEPHLANLLSDQAVTCPVQFERSDEDMESRPASHPNDKLLDTTHSIHCVSPCHSFAEPESSDDNQEYDDLKPEDIEELNNLHLTENDFNPEDSEQLFNLGETDDCAYVERESFIAKHRQDDGIVENEPFDFYSNDQDIEELCNILTFDDGPGEELDTNNSPPNFQDLPLEFGDSLEESHMVGSNTDNWNDKFRTFQELHPDHFFMDDRLCDMGLNENDYFPLTWCSSYSPLT